MVETLRRQWLLLRSIPRHPLRVSTIDIVRRLQAQGIETSLRTIQRDLNTLAGSFPLDSDAARPQGWWWRKNTEQFNIPGIDPHTALVFNLVESHMGQILPPSTISFLDPWFKAAKATLRESDSMLSSWPEKLHVVPRSLHTLAPSVATTNQTIIFDALLLGKQAAVTYRPIGASSLEKSYLVHPQTLVVRDQSMYLICTVKDYENPIFLAMHRITSATLTEKPARRIRHLKPNDLINREFAISLGESPINLKMLVRGKLADYLIESPLCADQKIRETEDSWKELSSTVHDTMLLRSWIRSLGPDAVVLSPDQLRKNILEEARETVSRYSQSRPSSLSGLS